MISVLRRTLFYLWAAPASALALVLLACACRGARLYWRDGVLEATGPRITFWLSRPWYGGGRVAAAALGHVVFGRDEGALHRCRAHEHTHVRQYERWGVLLLPAYLTAGVIARLQGGDAYLDNYFERQARAAEVAAIPKNSGQRSI